MQQVTLLGNIGKDAEERQTKTGKRLISFSLAVTVRKNVTVWYDITIWEERIKLYESIIPYLKKGSRIILGGVLQAPEIYQSRDGQTKVRMRCEPLFINFVGAPKQESTDNQEKPSIFADEDQSQEVPF